MTVADSPTDPTSPQRVARDLGWAAYRRHAEPYAIKDRQLDALTDADAIPPGPGAAEARDIIYLAWFDGYQAAATAGEPRTDPPLPVPRLALTITHDSENGTLLEGSVKGDGAWEAIRAAQKTGKITGWRYMPSIRMVAVSHSRDRAPKLYLIDTTATVLREAGFEVAVEIDGQPRAMAQAESDRADRMDGRAAALAGKAERRADESDARYAAAHEIAHGIPMGQPVLVGHHSERGHRAALKRMDGHMRRSVEAAAEAERAADAAASAERHMQARNNPRRVYRRIRTQEAELRKVERMRAACPISGRKLAKDGAGRTLRCPACHTEVPGEAGLLFPVHGGAHSRHREQLDYQAAHLTEQLRWWREALQAARDSGVDVPPDTDAISKGNWIRSWAGWREVTRVNKVSVSIRDTYGNPNVPADTPSQWFTRTIPLDEIQEIRETSPFQPAPAAPDFVDVGDAAAAPATAEPETAPATAATAPPAAPARRTSGLSDAAWEALQGAAATERSVHLPPTVLPRPVYVEVDRFLSRLAGGGRWDRRERAHVYNRDPRPDLEAAVGARVLPPASATDDKRLAYFATPADLAKRMAGELGTLHQGARVLEPSAGDGALVAAVRSVHPGAYVLAVEVDAVRSRLLDRRFRTAEQRDGWSVPAGNAVKVIAPASGTRFQDYAESRAEAQESRHPADQRPFHAVIMNPPFTEPGDRTAWATHFQLAWKLLRPGGRMVAILPCSYRYAANRHADAVRALVDGSAGVVDDLPDSTFAQAGTRVRTVLVRATRR